MKNTRLKNTKAIMNAELQEHPVHGPGQKVKWLVAPLMNGALSGCAMACKYHDCFIELVYNDHTREGAYLPDQQFDEDVNWFDLVGNVQAKARAATAKVSACVHEFEPMCERTRTGEVIDAWGQCVHCGQLS
jgi:hypothetical protein